MYEAAWEESEEYKIATEKLDEVILDEYGTPYLDQKSEEKRGLKRTKQSS